MICYQIIKECKLFGWPLPTPLEVRHKRQVSEEIDKIEQVRAELGARSFWTSRHFGKWPKTGFDASVAMGPIGIDDRTKRSGCRLNYM
jgi:hypothetical protein